MKKLNKLIFIFSLLACFFPVIYFRSVIKRWYVYNSFTYVFCIIRDVIELSRFSKIKASDIVLIIVNLSYTLLFVFYFVMFLRKKQTLLLSTIIALLGANQHITRFYVCCVTIAEKDFEFISVFGIIEMFVIFLLYLATVGLIIYAWIKVIKSHPHRPTKAERLEARVAELEQQVEDLKKGD